MSDFPKILNTDLIDAKTDYLWTDETGKLNELQPKDVLVLTHTYNQGSNAEIQLNKILSACKLETTGINIIQINSDEKLAWKLIKSTLSPVTVISFGITPEQLGISALFALNAQNNFDNTVIIPSLSLDELEQQPQAKKDLWSNALKPIFADK